jgi:ProP effector
LIRVKYVFFKSYQRKKLKKSNGESYFVLYNKMMILFKRNRIISVDACKQFINIVHCPLISKANSFIIVLVISNYENTKSQSLYFTKIKGISMSKQELHPRTAVLNKNQKNNSKKLREKALQWLASNFPLAFDNTLRIRPLKAGIMEEILHYADKAAADGVSKGKLREAVVIFTRRLDYLACLKSREMRVDLQGNELCEVTLEEAEHAAIKIRKRVEKSARNARKLLGSKSSTPFIASTNQNSAPPKPSSTNHEQGDYLPTYPSRSTPYNSNSAPPAKVSSVIVKHKTTRQFDPSAVARLKEKLGLSRAMEENKEMVE